MVGVEVDVVGSISGFAIYTEEGKRVSIADLQVEEGEGVVGFSFVGEIDGGLN